jgi:putative transposase
MRCQVPISVNPELCQICADRLTIFESRPCCLYGERMAKRRREWVEGGIYHVFSRGSNRQAIFLNGGDYVEFDTLLAESVRRYELDVFGWSLMPNHWHAVVRSPAGGLSAFMKSVNHRYALRFDRRWGRTAHVFENRFGAVLQETEEQLLHTLRYVVRNPVEARLCASPFDAAWTSFPATAGLAPAPPYLRVGEILEMFGGGDDVARQRYIDFVMLESDASPGAAVVLDARAILA